MNGNEHLWRQFEKLGEMIGDGLHLEENGKVPTEVVNKLMGRKTSRRVLKTWNEDFVDEDNGEVVSIERNEIIVDKNTIIDRDVLDEIINVQAKSIFIHKFQ